MTQTTITPAMQACAETTADWLAKEEDASLHTLVHIFYSATSLDTFSASERKAILTLALDLYINHPDSEEV